MRRSIFLLIIASFVVLLLLALGREVLRERENAKSSVNALVRASDALFNSGQVDMARTDRLALLLVDPLTQETVALKIVSPLLLPQAVQIGQAETEQKLGKQEYLLIAITDKDGEILKFSAGEAYGSVPALIGEKNVPLMLTEAYQGGLYNRGASQTNLIDSNITNSNFTIAGIVDTKLPYEPSAEGRLIIMLFDTETNQPVAINITRKDKLPQPFSIALPLNVRKDRKKGYQLRILTDKNSDPFQPSPGEIVGRSANEIPLGTYNLQFLLDEEYALRP